MSEDQIYHTIRDIARALNISYGKARLLVMDEPDVLAFGERIKKMRRIPDEVYLRIIRRAANPVRSTSSKPRLGRVG